MLTRDGHHILFHDGTLDGKTDLTGPVREHTLEEIRKADAGQSSPSGSPASDS